MAKRGRLSGDFEIVNELSRPERAKKYKYLFLIVCEDENTEKRYFESFKSRIPEETIFLMAVGTGKDQKGIVEQAMSERDKLEAYSKKEVDRVWVVFDKDDADLNDARKGRFREAFEIGNAENFRFAYSNEVFELWLLLHLDDVDPAVPMPRKMIYDLLESKVRERDGYQDFVYKHGNAEILDVISKIGDEKAALIRAKELIASHGDKSLLECNPMTYVNRLVTDLYEWIEYWSFEEN